MLLTPETRGLFLPEERELITDLAAEIEVPRYLGMPAYRRDLPQHNDQHISEETLPVGMRLVAQDVENNTPHNRLIVGAAIVVHDMWSHIPLDPQEGFGTKEERTAALAKPLLRAYFDQPDTEEVQGAVITTSIRFPVKTPNQVKVRRADISNVGSKSRTLFLATTVRLFQEEVILCQEAREELPVWTPFLDRQHGVLSILLADDLSVSPEKQIGGVGSFKRQADRNNNMLSSNQFVRNPVLFVRHNKLRLRRVIPDFDDIVPYMTGIAPA